MTEPERVLQALLGICGPGFARPAGPADTMAGRQAAFVAAPGNPDAVAALLRLANEKGHAVRARGAGTKLDWGAAPAHLDLLLDTGRLAGVWHTDGESVARVGAGTPVRAVQATLAQHGKRLAIDPPSTGATLGGVLAVDEAGPLRHRFGTPCDQLVRVRHVDSTGVGREHVRGTGRSGRKANGEALRDICGDQGRSGVVVSATVRVEPMPAARSWVSRPVWTPLEVHELVQKTLDADLAPTAVEVDLPAMPSRTPAPSGRGPGTLAVLLEGTETTVGDRANALAWLFGREATVADVAPLWWGRYPFTVGEVAVRISVPIRELHAAVYALSDAAGTAVALRGSAGVGLVHAALHGDTHPTRVAEIIEAVRGVLLGRGGRCEVIAAPPGVRSAVDLDDGD